MNAYRALTVPFFLLGCSAPLIAQAAVKSATVYPSHAQILWGEDVQFDKGNGVIELDDLPVGLQDETLQAQLLNAPGLQIQRVQVQRIEKADVVAETTRELQKQLREVEQKIGAKEDRIQAWNQQVTLMSHAAQAPGEVTASELDLLASTVQERTGAALEKIRSIRVEMIDDIAERDRLERELAQTQQTSRATKRVRIAYNADESGSAKAELRYQTQGASWQSQYNARLSTNGELSLEHLAVVRQSTGTDWENIDLSLSTVNARLGATHPPLSPWIVTPGASGKYAAKVQMSRSMDTMAMQEASSPMMAAPQNDGRFTQSYRIPAKVSLRSGTDNQQLTVASYKLPVDVETRFYPAVNLNGFVYASGTFDGEVALPPGQVTLYRDGQSVGRSHLNSLTNGDELSMGFGVNDRVTAKVVNEEDETGEQGVFQGEKYVRRINRYEITNSHPELVAIKVYDRIPVSRHDELTVKELEITKPVSRNVDDMKGVLAWDRTLESGQTVSLRSGFEVRVPEDSELPPLFR